MTYPPQPPGPYGSQPPDPYGQQPGPYSGPPQPDPYSQQTSYQGLGTYPTGPSEPPPPKKSNTGTIVAIALVALLVLGGGGTAVYFLTKKKDDTTTSASGNQSGNTSTTGPQTTSRTDDTTSASDTPSSPGQTSPAGVQQAYIEAYESKKFGPVVNSACDAYKKKFGTDTTDLEKQLAPYDIKASADGSPEVVGSTATAKINLELTKGSETKTPKIKIKIVKESGSWKFCGEGEG